MRRIGALLALAACSGSAPSRDLDSDPPSTDGGAVTTPAATVPLSVDIDPDLIPTMQEPAVGVFRGSVYAEADATPFGPNADAVSLADFTTETLDFGADGGTVATATVLGPFDAQVVWILGCFDSDDNDCDKSDPVTIPNEDKFQIVGPETAVTLKLSLLNPS